MRGLLELYRDHGAFNQDVDAALDVMREWYNGYRFAKNAPGDLYNTDMVLHYLKDSVPNKPMPDDLIDTNVRIDYTKLRHLLLVNQRASAEARRLNGNFDLLRHLIGEGETEADLNLSFPLEELDEPENFLSLLYYFGLLSIRGVSGGTTRLGIPNQTVWRLMYGYLRGAYRDVGVFSVSHHHFSRLVRGIAYKGEWRPAMEYIVAGAIVKSGVRVVVHAAALRSSMTSMPSLELPRFRGPLTIVQRRCPDGRKTSPLRAGVPAPDGGVGAGRSHARGAGSGVRVLGAGGAQLGPSGGPR